MALFGPAARLERCLWWQEFSHWPNGASESDRAGCYDRVFGRTASPGGTARDPRKQLSTTIPSKKQKNPLVMEVGTDQTTPVIPRNDLLVVVVLVAVAWLMHRYL